MHFLMDTEPTILTGKKDTRKILIEKGISRVLEGLGLIREYVSEDDIPFSVLYELGKAALQPLVGHYAVHDLDELKTSAEYEFVICKLVEKIS